MKFSKRFTSPPRGLVGLLCAAVVLVAGAPAALGAGRGEPGPIYEVRVPIVDEVRDLKILHTLDLDVDGVFDGWARVYMVAEEIEKIGHFGFDPEILGRNDVPRPVAPSEGSTTSGTESVPAAYHDYASLTLDLQQIAADHPDIARLVSLGTSAQGRDLWMMKLSRNPDVEEDEPEFAYISSMHGDEVVGKELTYNLIDYLTDNDGVDPRITQLIDTTEIWIMPSMNPDGTALSRRYTANWIDLNRDFPDQFVDPVNTPAGRAVETQHVMNWRDDRRLVLSANFHGGALVANYAYDSNTAGTSTYSPTDDDGVMVSISRTYADANPPMSTSNGSSAFFDGITNGADWYAINGGMQDWHYVWYGGPDVTLEVSNTKWPPASSLPGHWDDNLESMLQYLERAHEGLRGVATDALTGSPLDATVTVSGSDAPTYTDPDVGDWHRLVLPGSYRLEIASPGYVTKMLDVTVPPGPAVRFDAALVPSGPALEVVGGCGDPDGNCDPFLGIGPNDLSLTLRNLGIAQTGIEGTIVGTGWFGDVSRADATYPDLAADASGSSDAPYHALSVDAAAPAGHKIGLAVRWSGDQGSGTSEPFFFPVDAESCVSQAATGLPLPVLDRSSVANSLNLPSALELTRLEVTVDVRHGYEGDLRIAIVSPSGTRAYLHDRSGGSQDDVIGTYGVDLTSFDPLDRFVGETTAGDWTLEVEDTAPGTTGTLDAWSLNACGRPFEASPPEMRLHTASVEGGAARFEWWPYPGLDSYRVYRSTDPSSAAAFVDVTAEDGDPTDTAFEDATPGTVLYYLVTGVGPNGEGPKGHFGE